MMPRTGNRQIDNRSRGGEFLVGARCDYRPVDLRSLDRQDTRRKPGGFAYVMTPQTRGFMRIVLLLNWGGRNCSPLFYSAFNGSRHILFDLDHHACKHSIQSAESHSSTPSQIAGFDTQQSSERPNNAVHEFPRTGSSYDR